VDDHHRKKRLVLLITGEGVIADRAPRCADLALSCKAGSRWLSGEHGPAPKRVFDAAGHLVSSATVTATDMLTAPGMPPIFYQFTAEQNQGTERWWQSATGSLVAEGDAVHV
jgi:hypothetical protein